MLTTHSQALTSFSLMIADVSVLTYYPCHSMVALIANLDDISTPVNATFGHDGLPGTINKISWLTASMFFMDQAFGVGPSRAPEPRV